MYGGWNLRTVSEVMIFLGSMKSRYPGRLYRDGLEAVVISGIVGPKDPAAIGAAEGRSNREYR